ncbi:tetratricopeptide repeat protein [Streptomyces sp. NPDC059385]|uniref:tetratricopeptide repeat protein n=1 Tax=Streptomyces sp. NPDC059385 TaxID=3346817 RepID=UPI0036CF4D5A
MTQVPSGGTAGVQQVVHVENGFGYGCIGADIHVFGDGRPVYLLFGHRRRTGLESPWLRAQPSRMLDARAEIVDFTGRAAELEELVTWRDTGPRLSVRWLHGQGGQGKTRLANLLAAESLDAGWKVVDATHGTDAHPPAEGGQDLRPDGHTGILLLVDYADRWPLADLSWLLHNRILRHSLPARVLLVGRSAIGWPALRGKLAQFREAIDTSDQFLPPLPDDGSARQRMFTTAYECFARHYPQMDEPRAITPPDALDDPDFGVTLVVHMAALVAVDAAAHGRRAPADMVGRTVYLLDREHENWRQLYENARHGLDFRTPDQDMARAVFAATLIGPADRRTARSVVERLMPYASAERILLDHGVCYPPGEPAGLNSLEPLLPDRLAEDFVALMLPGSPVTGYPPDDWAASVPAAVLRRGDDGAAPVWTPRTVAHLAAAADRWPHVGEGYLYPLVKADPRIALDAGSAALGALARIAEGEVLDGSLLGVLESIDTVLPADRHVDLDVGIAAVAERLTDRRLADTESAVDRAILHSRLSARYAHAGLADKAVASAERATTMFRTLAQADPQAHRAGLAGALVNLSAYLPVMGREAEELVVAEEAAAISRELMAGDQESDPSVLSGALINLGSALLRHRRPQEALQVTMEAAAILLQGDVATRQRYVVPVATAADNLGMIFSALKRPRDALAAADSAIELLQLVAEQNQSACLPDLARALRNRAMWLRELGLPQEAALALEEVVTTSRQLAIANSAAHEPGLAVALDNLGSYQVDAGWPDEAVPTLEEAVALFRRLATINPDAHEPALAKSLNNLSAVFARLGRLDEASQVMREAVDVGRRLADVDPAAHLPDFALALDNLCALLGGMRRPEALAALREAIDARRRLAEAEPDAQLGRLIALLEELATRLRAAGRLREALAPLREMVEIHRRLAGTGSEGHQAGLARSLVNLSSLLADAEEDGALLAAREALAVYWRLVAADPATHLPHLAVSVNRLNSLLVKGERYDEALTAADEVVGNLRRLSPADPALYRPFIAKALWGAGRLRAARGSGLPQAEVTLEEAVALYVQLAAYAPHEHADDLRGALITYAAVLDKLGSTARADRIRRVTQTEATMDAVYEALACR